MKVNVVLFLFTFTFFVLTFGNQLNYIYISEDDIPEFQYLNKSVDPCDNFYEFACGNFKNVHPRPESEQIWDHFTILQAEIHKILKVILESKREPTESVALQKSKAFYKSCLNVDYVDNLKLSEARVLNSLGGWPLVGIDFDPNNFSWEYVADVIAEYGLSMFFQISVGPNLFNATENAIWVLKDSMPNPATIIGRPQRDEFDFLSSRGPRKRSAEPIPFEAFLRKISLRLKQELGSPKSEDEIYGDISETLEFMRVLMKGGIVNETIGFLNPTPTVEQFQKWTDEKFGRSLSMNWLTFLNRVFKYSGSKVTKQTKLLVNDYRLVYGVLNLMRLSEPRIIQNFILVRLFTYMAPDSDRVMREAFNEYYQNQHYEVFPREEYCLRKTLGYPNNIDFSMALTYEYQRYHFNINKLQSAADMVSDLREAFHDILNESDWIDEVTKEKAAKKAENMYILLGYPEYADSAELLDEFYENLRICTWDHFGNSQRLRAFRQALQFSQIDSVRVRERWSNSPLEVNAFYSRPNNRIVFPVSILDPVFFTGYISALDYGRIGAIIGHEITHGFDSGGKNYDENGSFKNWWSNTTSQAFNDRVGCFIDQYSGYRIEEIGAQVNGSQTLNENLADNGGLREAFKAFKKLEKKSSSLVTVESYTPEQLFFIGFGTMWCMQESNAYLQNMHDKGLYPPGRYRVIGAVSNLEDFATTFNCPKGSAMNPEKKCRLW